MIPRCLFFSLPLQRVLSLGGALGASAGLSEALAEAEALAQALPKFFTGSKDSASLTGGGVCSGACAGGDTGAGLGYASRLLRCGVLMALLGPSADAAHRPVLDPVTQASVFLLHLRYFSFPFDFFFLFCSNVAHF